MSFFAAFLYTTSAAWHGVNAYYFLLKSEPFVATYRAADERNDTLAADVISWHGGLHGVLSAYALISAFRVFSLPRLDLQIPLLLGAAAASQAVLVRPDDNWRPELRWLSIVSTGLAVLHGMLALYIYRASSKGMIVGVIDSVQNFLK